MSYLVLRDSLSRTWLYNEVPVPTVSLSILSIVGPENNNKELVILFGNYLPNIPFLFSFSSSFFLNDCFQDIFKVRFMKKKVSKMSLRLQVQSF